MSQKVYFYSISGVELETELNRKDFASCSSYISHKISNDLYAPNKTETVKGELNSRDSICLFKSSIPGDFESINVSISSFPGHEKVLVKIWSLYGEDEWFVLEEKKENEEYLCNVNF